VKKGIEMSEKKIDIHNKQFAYNILLQGYHSRDETMPRTFYHMVKTFSIFNVLLFGSQYIGFIDKNSGNYYYITLAIYLLIAIAGFISLFAFLLDMEGVSSGKNALRATCRELEKDLATISNSSDPLYWNSIANRNKYLLERMLKSYTKEGVAELRTGGFGYLKASKIIVLLWGVASIIYGFILFNIKIYVGF